MQHDPLIHPQGGDQSKGILPPWKKNLLLLMGGVFPFCFLAVLRLFFLLESGSDSFHQVMKTCAAFERERSMHLDLSTCFALQRRFFGKALLRGAKHYVRGLSKFGSRHVPLHLCVVSELFLHHEGCDSFENGHHHAGSQLSLLPSSESSISCKSHVRRGAKIMTTMTTTTTRMTGKMSVRFQKPKLPQEINQTSCTIQKESQTEPYTPSPNNDSALAASYH